MKADTIVTMLSDPNIDPTSWVGEALVEWVAKNLTRCLSDETARDYLFKGMDVSDLGNVCPEVVRIYSESKDPTIIKKFVDGVNSAYAQQGPNGYGGKWAINSVGRELNEIVDGNIVDYVVKLRMPEGDENWPKTLIEIMKDYHVAPVLSNRLLNWGELGFTDIIDIIPQEKIFRTFADDMWVKHLCHNKTRSWPKNVQNVLYHMLLSLPKEDALNWMKWIQTTEAPGIWLGMPELISKQWGGQPILFGETVCRCGKIAKSKSGAALHRNRCDHGESPNIHDLSRIFLKIGCPSLHICDKCSKTCKSNPGLALHRKKCKSTLGLKFREARSNLQIVRQMRTEKDNANAIEN